MHILRLKVETADDWNLAYQPDFKCGGLFVPTTTELKVGEVVIVEVAASVLPNKVMLRCVTRSWRPALPRLRVRAGAVVEIEADEVGKRDFIRDVLSGHRGGGKKRKQNRLPLAVAARYRLTPGNANIDTMMSELSIGGATLATAVPLPIDAEVVIEIVPPGAAAAIAISGKVAYHVPTGATGVRFLVRDSDGARRLKELLRRLKAL